MKTTNNQLNSETMNLLKTLKGKVIESIVHERFKHESPLPMGSFILL